MRPSELIGVDCRHCAYRLDELVMLVEWLAELPSTEERDEGAVVDQIAEHRERLAAFRGRR